MVRTDLHRETSTLKAGGPVGNKWRYVDGALQPAQQGQLQHDLWDAVAQSTVPAKKFEGTEPILTDSVQYSVRTEVLQQGLQPQRTVTRNEFNNLKKE